MTYSRSDALIERGLLTLIVTAYLVIATLYAVRTPLWQVPDEPAHYNYIRQIATVGCCPVIQAGDWDNDYLEAIKAARFSPASIGDRLGTIQYEDHQPPLYYLLAAPLYTASNGDPISLRLFSLALGACTIIVTWGTLRLLVPSRPSMALTAAGFVAFLPQHIAMMAGINNDSLAELIIALILFGCVAYVGNGKREGWIVRLFSQPLTLGILYGIGLLTKLTVYPLAAVIGLAVLLRARSDGWTWRRVIGQLVWIGIPALICGGILWGRNLSVYGGLDFLAQNAHDHVVVGQKQTMDYISEHGVRGWIGDALQTTFHSFWGQFGWMGVPMTDTIYAALLAFSAFVLSGAVIAFVRWRGKLTPPQHHALLIFALSFALAVATITYWNLKFVQFQGRYLFPGLIPIAALVAFGIAGWLSLISARAPILRWIAPLIPFGLAALSIYALFRIILPALVIVN
ncbi:MAG: glycosyltransferase family 39 protein [Anaerolineae bacterium]|nr:glycosyltransferase family 39 protein [Anaerolineae bacterium]